MPRVRPGDAADLPILRRIQAAAIAEPWPELLELAAGHGPRLRVVETTRPVGYAVVLTADCAAYLPELAVEPAVQGEGLGSRLLESVVDELVIEGTERIRLTARAADDRTRSFYEGHGFEAVDRHR